MKSTLTVLMIAFLICGVKAQGNAEKQHINKVLDAWHKAAADADFDAYFDHMTEDAVFIGTDATENWKGKAFKTFAKPYFDRGKAWSFTALERNVYLAAGTRMAWFDELLDTQMKICRGSGVLVKTNGTWKIKHYVLSVTVPNDNVRELIDLKKSTDNKLMDALREKQ
ncbi:nuclear transport factor 2 family protein [Sinomicrobium kalidii]|uniref:nuclear transport factor 2 family protein n=1 Tax=Sinomicrobium kalidii TaxID=2900738 RepID=UPI001E2B3871|nr:nuclear transport factor 2 family protein [Sinomicrobium kalidii]UGU14421.1 nuclear transport factor 2 family protein [Sinomicrobium kalidii]